MGGALSTGLGARVFGGMQLGVLVMAQMVCAAVIVVQTIPNLIHIYRQKQPVVNPLPALIAQWVDTQSGQEEPDER